MSKLFWLVKLLSGRGSMKGILVASGIGIVVLLALFAWGAVAQESIESDSIDTTDLAH